MTTPSRTAIIAAAVALLRAGTLPSSLPIRLMTEFGLSQTLARELAGVAVRRWRAQKPPRNSESNGGKVEGRGE